jgi:cytochrome c
MEIRHMSRARPWLFMGAALGLLVGGAALAQQPSMEDLKQTPTSRQITTVAYCRGEYAVGLADGSVKKFGERDLRFATDSSALGPPPGRAVLVPTGRVGDRALVVFVGPVEMTAAVRLGC